jgi:type II secretory pathway predicted ATPase ExeA
MRRGFVFLTGEVGTGKTSLHKTVLGSFVKGRVSSAFVFNPRLDVLDFLEFVLTDFGIPPTARTKSGMLLQLNRWLIDRFKDRGICVIVVDEAQNLSWELLEEIRLLTNLETSTEKLVQIVLSGQPELHEKLCHPSVRQLRQRVSLWCKTQPLTPEETEAYITERLRIAGVTTPVLAPESVKVVYRYSKGIPRVINLICEHSMIEAYAEQEQKAHEQAHHQPGLAAVRRLLFVEIHFLDRSTVGTSRSACSVISKSSDGLKPSMFAKMFVGKTCCAVLNFVAMSL